jgi:Helitron helicase-like domain at N-terminus
VTLNPAEWQWEELFNFYEKVHGVPVDKQNVEEFIAKDPAIFCSHFQQRMKTLLELICRPDGPLGNVVHYFHRDEYQGRGNTHKHCLFWVKDAPQIGRDSPETIRGFVEKYVTCRLPDPVTEPELNRLVVQNQKHKCTGLLIFT